MVLFDDTLALARHRPAIEMAKGWGCVPYLFGVAIYCFGARLPLAAILRCCIVSAVSVCCFSPQLRAAAEAAQQRADEINVEVVTASDCL